MFTNQILFKLDMMIGNTELKSYTQGAVTIVIKGLRDRKRLELL